MNPILEAALKYLEKGYSVIPVGTDKRPLIKWEPYQKQRATKEEIQIWFKKFPSANIGIVTGELSNLLIVDTDLPEATTRIQEAIPDSLVVPCQQTPSGGMHFVFCHSQGFVNRARVAEGIDIRTSGGYFVAAPSINGNGKHWDWVVSPFEVDPLKIEFALGSIIKDLSLSFSLHGDVIQAQIAEYNNISQVSQSITSFFSDGVRDEHLIHTAICLQRGGAEPDFARYVLNILVNSWGENDPKWVDLKIKSAWDRANRRERNIAQEVRSWVEMMSETSQTGNINFTEFHKDNNVSQKRDLQAARMAFKRLCDEEVPLIERSGERAGQYRIINRDDNEQKWWLDEGKPLSLVMPLHIENYAKIFPGNIILLEGQKSQGKSTFALEFSRLNRDLYPNKKISYQNVEMSDSEIKDRFRHYRDRGIVEMEEWPKFLKITKRTSDWADKIEPDGINIIDYLIEYDKPYILPGFIFNIHKKLKTGIALCIVQRDPFKPYPSGGRGTRDIPRLIISLINHRLLLEDVKSFWESDFGNPSKLSIRYKQVAYCEWKADGEWERTEDLKYDAFKKDYKSFTKED